MGQFRNNSVQLFTDGSCRPNPGAGGWSFILRHPATNKQIERFGGENMTTSNRMELTAVVRGLEELRFPCDVDLFTDSTYVGKGLTKWMPKWRRGGWRRRRSKAVKNEDLWRKLSILLETHSLRYTHVLGHSGHPENERCDRMAFKAMSNQ